jgi:putative transposase
MYLRKLFAWDMERSVDCCQATSTFVLAAPHSIFNVQRHLMSARTHRAFRAAAMNVWREAVAVG